MNETTTSPVDDFREELAANPELIVILSPVSIAGSGGGEVRADDLETYGTLTADGEYLTFTDDNGRDWVVEI